MEKKTHILFTYTWIYWTAYLCKDLGIFNLYQNLIYNIPLITIPYMAIVTMLPDSDIKNWRINRTVLWPIWVIIRYFVNHRWFTHRLSWILFFWMILFLLSLIWTNIIILAIISFLAITCIWILVDDFRINIFWIKIKKIWWVRFDNKLIDKFLTVLIVLFFPLLLIPEIYNSFLIGLFFAYIFHMFWDALSKEWWTIIKIPFSNKEIKFQLPKKLSFRVGWKVERNLIKTILRVTLVILIYIERDFFINKFIYEIKMSSEEVINIINNPEILLSDITDIKYRLKETIESIRDILTKIIEFLQ